MGRAKRRKLAARGSGAPSHAVDRDGRAGAVAATLRVSRSDAATLAAAVLGPLALYVSTLPPTVVGEDDGLFLMAGANLGIGHPPGYPLYTLIVHLFTRLPFGDAAFLGHLSSAVLGALACGAVYGCARLLRAAPAPALAAAWLFGVSEQFWSQAIIAEVYTLNALLFFATYALVLVGARDSRPGWPLVAAAVTWGAGLANHWPLMMLATPGLLLALLPAWRAVLPRLPRLLAVALLSAALPYGWMVWLSHQAPFISFYGGSIDTWRELWFFLSREGYSGVDASPSAGWSDRASFLGWFAGDLVRQTTLPGVALAIIGVGALARAGGLAAVATAGSGLLALAGNSVVLMLLLNFDFDAFMVGVFRPYPLICYGVAALWVAAGMQRLLDHPPGWASARLPALAAAVSRVPAARRTTGLAALAGGVLVAVSASTSWRANDRSGSDFAERHAQAMFELLPQDAALFAHGDNTSPIGYYRYVEGRRPDVALYNLQGVVFGNRLYDPGRPVEEMVNALDRFIDSTPRAVFLFPDTDIYPRGRAIRHHGFLLEMLKEGSAGTVELTRDPRGERYFLELLERRPADSWEQAWRNGLLQYYGNYLGAAVLSDSPLVEPLEPLFQRAHDCYACLMGMASLFLENSAADHANRIAAWLTRAEALHDQAIRKETSAWLRYEQGRLAELTGDAAAAAVRYREAYAIHPHPESSAGDALRRLGLSLP